MSIHLFKIAIQYSNKDEPDAWKPMPERKISEGEERDIREHIDMFQEYYLDDEFPINKAPQIIRVEIFSDHIDLYVKWCQKYIGAFEDKLNAWIGRDYPDAVKCDNGSVLIYENYSDVEKGIIPVRGHCYYGEV